MNKVPNDWHVLKMYATDTKCPFCEVDLYKQLYEHVMSGMGESSTYFHFKCPLCGEMFQVDVEPIPAFTITKMNEVES